MYTFSKSSRCEMKVWCSLTKGFNPLCIYRKSNLEYIYIANFCYKTHNFLFCRSSSTAGLIFGVLNSRATIFIFPHFIQIRLHRYFKCPTKPRLWWGRAFHTPLLINKPKINQKSWKFETKEDVIHGCSSFYRVLLLLLVWPYSLHYSQVPIKQVGPNKRVGWVFYVNLLNK